MGELVSCPLLNRETERITVPSFFGGELSEESRVGRESHGDREEEGVYTGAVNVGLDSGAGGGFHSTTWVFSPAPLPLAWREINC